MNTVHCGETLVAEDVTITPMARVVKYRTSGKRGPAGDRGDRLVAAGKTDREIGEDHFISVKTVGTLLNVRGSYHLLLTLAC